MAALVPLNLDLDYVSNYNTHGAALVQLLKEREISSLHHRLILGMFAVDSALVSMCYFKEDDISWLPHAEFIDQEGLDIGFDQKAVEILSLLPFPKRQTEHQLRTQRAAVHLHNLCPDMHFRRLVAQCRH